MKKIILLVGSAALLSMASCTVYHQYYTTGGPVGTKVGVSSAWTFSKEDYSLQTAAKNGGINKIGTVDVIVKSYILVLNKKTIVTGE